MHWHDVMPALNSLLITLSIYVFLVLNLEIRARIMALESKSRKTDAGSQAEEPRGGRAGEKKA